MLAKAKRGQGNDNDNDNDTLREVPHQSNEGLALQARVSGHDPSKKNLFYWGSLLIGKVCKYKLLWTECNASRLEMNSMYKKTTKKRDHTGCCCAEFSTNSLNPQIRSNTTDRTRRTKGARKPEGETRKPGGTRAPGGWRDTAVQQSHLLLIPNFVLSYNK